MQSILALEECYKATIAPLHHSNATDLTKPFGSRVDRHEPAAFAAALERLLTDAPLRERMSQAARRAAERFALPAIAAAYDGAFTEVLA